MSEKEPEQQFEEFQEQQDRIDELVKDLAKDLKLEKEQAIKALVDWLYINGEVDFLKLAAEKDAGE